MWNLWFLRSNGTWDFSFIKFVFNFKSVQLQFEPTFGLQQAYDEQVGECVLKMAEKLKQKGAQIVPVNFPEIFESFRAFVVTFGAEGVFHTTYGEFNKYKDDYSSNLVLLHTLSSKIKASHFLLVSHSLVKHVQIPSDFVSFC